MINIVLAWAPAAREVHELMMQVPSGCTVAEALEWADWKYRCSTLAQTGHAFGIWGRRVGVEAVLRDGDRLEIYRDLRVDPKVARRERFVGQGARAAGLFAQRRPGSKAGY